jgi:hypothetical protein
MTNPFAKETINLTEQGKLYRENPERYLAEKKYKGQTLFWFDFEKMPDSEKQTFRLGGGIVITPEQAAGL